LRYVRKSWFIPYNSLAGLEEFLEELRVRDEREGSDLLEGTIRNLVVQTDYHSPSLFLLRYDEWCYLAYRFLGWNVGFFRG